MTEPRQRQRICLCKKLDDWPEPDQILWRASLVPGDLFEDGGTRAGYSLLSNREVVAGYGRWLKWLEERELLDSGQRPGDRITPSRVRAYISDLEENNATQTLLNRLQQLRAAVQVFAPHQDWRWINAIASTIRQRHRPARPKGQRLVPLRVLFDLGLKLMETAEGMKTEGRRALFHRAALHRDGLIIAILAARQLRLSNLAGLVLDHTLVPNGTQWWIQIPASETKNKKAMERPWPEQLINPLQNYLTYYRGVLLGVPQSSQLGECALWLSVRGSRMTMAGVYSVVIARTREAFGRAINPHLFRDCTVTSLANEAPEHVGIGMRLLGHSTFSTTERYYNQARGLEASRLVQENILALRHNNRDKTRSKPIIREDR